MLCSELGINARADSRRPFYRECGGLGNLLHSCAQPQLLVLQVGFWALISACAAGVLLGSTGLDQFLSRRTLLLLLTGASTVVFSGLAYAVQVGHEPISVVDESFGVLAVFGVC